MILIFSGQHTYIFVLSKFRKRKPKKEKTEKILQISKKTFHVSLAHRLEGVPIEGEREYLTAFIDDCSRFIVSYGAFDAQTTKNTLTVLQKGIEEYGCPDQIITENGSQFCAMRTNNPSRQEFGKYLLDMKIKHIRSSIRIQVDFRLRHSG